MIAASLNWRYASARRARAFASASPLVNTMPASALPSRVVCLAIASALTSVTRACASPLVTWTAASAWPASLTRSASACAAAIRDCLSPSARRIWASASASAGRTVLAMSSFCVRSASSWASSVWRRTTSCCASAWASGPAWAAFASADAVSASTSAVRSDTSRWALSLICMRLGLADRGLLVGLGLGHPRVPLAAGRLLLADEVHVADLVADRLDREVVDRQARRREVGLGGALDLLLELLAVVVELLDGQRADDRAERALEDVLDDRLDLLVAVLEPLGGVADRLLVAADLDRRDALDRDLDALLGHGVGEVDVDLARGQVEPAQLVDQRQDDDAARRERP